MSNASSVRVLSAGVDSLELSVRGVIRDDVWASLEEARKRAEDGEQPTRLGEIGDFNVQGHGWRNYSIWLRSADCELMMTRNEHFPAVRVELSSAYLHSMDPWSAVGLVTLMLRHEVMAGEVAPTVSRVDLYADLVGWDLQIDDLRRFVSRAKGRGGRPVATEEGAERFWLLGRDLTGLDVGKRGGAIYARVYLKSTEIRRRGLSWLPELWGEERTDEPVWRVEFEIRRPLLVECGLRSVDDVLAGQQDLWRYATEEWLTYRTPQADLRVRRWPVDPVWRVVQAVQLHPSELGVVRGRIWDADEARLLVGAAGYLTTWASMHPEWPGLGGTLEHIRPILARYFESRGTGWAAEVARKRSLRMDVSSWLPPPEDGEAED